MFKHLIGFIGMAAMVAAATACGDHGGSSGNGGNASGPTGGPGPGGSSGDGTPATGSASSGGGSGCSDINESCFVDSDCQCKRCVYKNGESQGLCTKSCMDFSDCPAFWDCSPIGNDSNKACVPGD